MFDIHCPRKPAFRACGLLLMAVVMLAAGAPAHAAVCQVTTAGSAGGSGTWASPIDLQSALADPSCNEIWVAAGTYKPTTGTSRVISFYVRPSTAIYGGFAGNETQRNQRQPEVRITILSGDIGTPNDASDNTYQVVRLDGTTSAGIVDRNTVLDGFTIRDGNANGDYPQDLGGGLNCNGVTPGSECSPTLSQLIFTNNHAANQGGALYNNGRAGGFSNPILSYVTFDGNSAAYGGAVANDGSGVGGTSNPIFDHVTFSNNSAIESGGALYNSANFGGISSPTLSNVTFSNNDAEFGGAMMNSAAGGGWGLSNPSLLRVTFSGNSADIAGGAMYQSVAGGGTSSPILSNVTFSNNSADFGGGMVSRTSGPDGGTSKPHLYNVTFSNNSAHVSGGAIYNHVDSAGTHSPVLSNVILWGNTAGEADPEMTNYRGSVTIDHSVIAGGCASINVATCGSGNSDYNPDLGALANNGGWTQTMLPGAGGSAIDAGKAGTCANAYVNSRDQRGVRRPQGSGCDIGSVELSVADDIIFADGFEATGP